MWVDLDISLARVVRLGVSRWCEPVPVDYDESFVFLFLVICIHTAHHDTADQREQGVYAVHIVG